jgi:hypothetical protein
MKKYRPSSLTSALCFSALCFALLVLANTAFAQQPQTVEPQRSPGSNFGTSLTFSPIHLIFPEVYLSYEHKLTEKTSFGLVAGFGEVLKMPVFEIGGKFSGYTSGNFGGGYPVGVEVGYVTLSVENMDGTGINGKGSAFYFAPFVAYKYIAEVGFTFDLNVGLQIFSGSATATWPDGGQHTKDVNGAGPTLRALIGWSF